MSGGIGSYQLEGRLPPRPSMPGFRALSYRTGTIYAEAEHLDHGFCNLEDLADKKGSRSLRYRSARFRSNERMMSLIRPDFRDV